ncbi:MAG: ABC transporter ATP-binding protein [Myxococcales bacterium]|nr:ABC transporter ATP-binding protein [Myxococcales bacterium]
MGELSIFAENISVKFLIRHHHAERTLREAVLQSLVPSRRSRSARARQEFWALKNVDLVAQRGEVIGVIGRNGSGKSTLLKTLAGIIGADRGTVAVRGRVACLMSFGVGFNPNLTGRENVYLSGSMLGLSREKIDSIIDDVIEFSELGDFAHASVRTYSKGMRVRLGFSVAIHISPDVLLLDEVLTVGDEAFQRKAGNIIQHIRGEEQTVVIASHNMQLIREVCSRAVWLEAGCVRLQGEASAVCKAYIEEVRRTPQRLAAAAPPAPPSPMVAR